MNEQTTTKPRPQVATWAPSRTGPCARWRVDCITGAARPGAVIRK